MTQLAVHSSRIPAVNDLEQRIKEILEELWGASNCEEYLDLPQTELNGRTARQAIEDGDGKHVLVIVESYLDRPPWAYNPNES